MPLHPHMVVALTQLDDFEQDALERLCREDWDRVSYDFKHGHVYVGGRLTTFLLEPEDDGFDEEQYFVQDVIDLDAPPPPRALHLPHVQHPDTKRCVHCDAKMRQTDRGRECLSAPLSLAGAQALPDLDVPAEESPSTGDAQTGGLEPVTPSSAGHLVCKCGCGEIVINKPTGRRKLYASDACRGKHTKRLARERAKAATTPVPEAPVEQAVEKVERRVWCARCEQDGHFVEECPLPLGGRKAKKDSKAALSTAVDKPVDAFVKSQKESKAAAKKRYDSEGPRVLTCGRCKEKGHSIFTCTKQGDSAPVVVAAIQGEITDNDLTAHNHRLLDICRGGLPDRFQYSYKEDVLALYGIDFDLLDSALRSPDRVEIRPESYDKDKRYCVLAFYKGDLEVILGMRSPATPMVIAAYASSRLEHDTHRVGHSGGGAGGKKAAGLPKTPRQVVTRLRAMGGRELEVELSITDDYVPVTYKGQDLGKIATNGDRKTCEQDYQRIQRKMAAIDRRVATG